LFGWSADSRYAVFLSGDQYGNTATIVFDTSQWGFAGLSERPPLKSEICGMAGWCRHHPIAIAPTTARIVLADGTLAVLNNSSVNVNVLTTTDKTNVFAAAWSPGEEYLAFVAYDHERMTQSVYLLDEGSGQVYWIMDTEYPPPKSFIWNSDKQVVFETKDELHTMDAVTREVSTEPKPESQQ
jgi:hypothetical protein